MSVVLFTPTISTVMAKLLVLFHWNFYTIVIKYLVIYWFDNLLSKRNVLLFKIRQFVKLSSSAILHRNERLFFCKYYHAIFIFITFMIILLLCDLQLDLPWDSDCRLWHLIQYVPFLYTTDKAWLESYILNFRHNFTNTLFSFSDFCLF